MTSNNHVFASLNRKILRYGAGWGRGALSGLCLLLPLFSADVLMGADPPSVASLAPAPALPRLLPAEDATLLAHGDRLSFRIEEDREPATLLLVTDSGEVDFPLIGRLPAAGKTCSQLMREAKAAYEEEYYVQATLHLGVEMLNRNLGKVYLAGQLRNPGALDFPRDEVLTASKAVIRAGGFSDFADRRHVRIMRRQATPPSGRTQILIVDLVEILEKGDLSRDITLKPEDMIFVPARAVNF